MPDHSIDPATILRPTMSAKGKAVDRSQVEGHHQGHDHSVANREFFNDIAHKYDDRPHAREAARRIAAAMRTKMPALFQEDATDMMEYACGTGTCNMIARRPTL